MPHGADEVDVERQVRPVLLDRAAGDDADLAQLDGVVDLGPGQFLVAVFSRGSTGHDGSVLEREVRSRLSGSDSSISLETGRGACQGSRILEAGTMRSLLAFVAASSDTSARRFASGEQPADAGDPGTS